MNSATRMQPDAPQKQRLDIPNWLIALIALATVIFAAGALNARVSALENDHVGKTEVQDMKYTVDKMDKKIDRLLERKP
jgi:hypothetical protein